MVNLPPKKMMGEVSEGMILDIGYADGLLPAPGPAGAASAQRCPAGVTRRPRGEHSKSIEVRYITAGPRRP